jgi:nucleoside-diphosphate-sugar epimerase
MKILTIIGGSGFVGKSFLDAFNRGVLKKFKINKINLVSRNINKIKKTKLSLKNVRLITGDIGKIKSLPKSELIIYAADRYREIDRIKNIKKFIFESKKSIDNFCNIVKKNKKTKILFTSSGAIYRFNRENIQDANSLKGKQLYAYLKHYSEYKIKKLRQLKIKTSIARCFTFIGPWLPRETNFAVGNFLDNVLKKKKINVKSDSKVIRSYMYADDLIYWLTKICVNSRLDTPVFDVGSNKSIEIKSLAKLFSRLFKTKIQTKKIKKNKIDKYMPNIQPANVKLGLKIKYNLKEAILLTIDKINEKKN